MSTRSRTRPESSSVKPAAPGQLPKERQRSQKVDIRSSSDPDQAGKENRKLTGLKGKGDVSAGRRKSKAAAKKEYCICKRPDDGTPMVSCSECKDWYHFHCVGLSERDADEISIYICPTCTTATGRHTVKNWEGPDAIEECSEVEPARRLTPQHSEESEESSSEDSTEAQAEFESDDPSTEDEYVAEKDKRKERGIATKRRARRLSLTSESESDEEVTPSRRTSTSSKRESKPAVSSGNLKRKPHATSQQPPPKRQKSSTSSAPGDPTRAYCLKKLQEVFSGIFLRYPNIAGGGVAEGQSASPPVDKKLEDLREDEKTIIVDEANKFATDLEQCVYDIYSEPDAKGKPHAGSKYKERFRMLTFNLGKPDRVVLHKRIASSQISPKELSLMSSTDLADEETKQSIKIAEKEALEHSILQKTKAPTAKITHKGMVDIEDANSEGASMRERERERELEEEERRERERTARLRAAQAQQRRASQSQGSVPPESPIASQAGSWGGPPALPLHAMQANETMSPLSPSLASGRSPIDSFPQSASDTSVVVEPQLDLADLINIDDEPSSNDTAVRQEPMKHATSPPVDNQVQSTLASASMSPGPSSALPTGISPFAAVVAKPETPSRSSFNLDALWTAPAPKIDATTAPVSPPPTQDEHKTSILDTDILGQDADDQDFDMFLEKDQDEHNTPAPVIESLEAQQAILDSQPQVWSGKISMPLDTSIPQETPVVARQVGGRQLGADSFLWKTLFPSQLLRIEGRVPVNNSSNFLLQMRMNSTKELIAVALSPASVSDESGCKILREYLLERSRHGLVFPWGSRPKDHYPGKELYVIPLRAAEPLPDYMELLDDLRLPKTRICDLLVAIWVLNKGKLAPPTTPPIVPASLADPPMPGQPSVPSNPVPPATAPIQIAPEVLAAEVASLTPEQIKLMLQTLSASNALPPASNALPPAPVTQQSHISPPHNPLSASSPQSWQGFATGYPGTYGSPHMQQPHQPGSYSQVPYNRYDQGRGRYDHGGRDWNNDSRSRGRGRGRGRDYDDHRKPMDSGWDRPRHRGGWDGPSRGQGGWA